MESVFVGETEIDVNQWTNFNSEYHKLKIGEIFQLKDSSLSMTCTNCWQEFQYFTEFSLHIQEHYLRGEIAHLKEIKEEPPVEKERETLTVSDEDDQEDKDSIVKSELVENEVFEPSELDNDWSDNGFDDASLHSICEVDTKNEQSEKTEQLENTPKSMNYVDGTDYEKNSNGFQCLTCDHSSMNWNQFIEHLQTHLHPEGVACPICSKLFATVSYVRKHCGRTHQIKISGQKIKEAQTTSAPAIKDLAMMPKEVKKSSHEEGVHYKKIDDKFQCMQCDRKMAKFDHMKEHLLTHNSEKNVYCPICASAFITESYVRKHVTRTHGMKISGEQIKAAQLSIDVTQVKKVWASVKSKCETKAVRSNASEEIGTICCFFCPKRFTKARYAQKHMRLIHTKPMSISEVINSQPKKCPANVEPETQNLNDFTSSALVSYGCEIGSEPEKNFECFECHKQFVSFNSTRIHMKLHSGTKFICTYCDKIFAMKSYVRDHIVTMHGIKRDDIPSDSIKQAIDGYVYRSAPKIDSYECFLCNKKYMKRNRLREHMNLHVSGPYLCVICGAVYKSTDTLRHHMERHKANPNEPIQCPDCNKTYPTRRYMLSHRRTIHLNKRRKKTAAEKRSEVHCQICDKKFQNTHNLRQHMMVHNRDPNELTCHICGWEFKERSNLKQHMESHGNNKTTCEICNKVLSIRYLQEHQKIHSGNKEHQCSTCGKQFVSRERLKRHMIRHYGEPKYKCELCPKAYTRSDKLLYHRRTHDQQMTHTCQSCGKGFFSIKSLRKHENKHYLEDNGILKPIE